MILKDRATSVSYQIGIKNRQFHFDETLSASRPDPVFKDAVTSQYWKLFISNRKFGYEPSSLQINQTVTLLDTTSGLRYTLIIRNRVFGFFVVAGFKVRICRMFTEGYTLQKLSTKSFLDMNLKTKTRRV